MGKFYLLSAVILFFGLCHGVSKASECSARGRFPNDEVKDCRGYTMCLMGGLTNFTQYKLTCPTGFVYSHIEAQCTNTTNYKCYPAFNCTDVGNFAVPENTDCSSFVACIGGLDGIDTARLVNCPLNMSFNTEASACVDNTGFTCPDHHLVLNNAIIINIQCSLIISLVLLQTVLL